LSGREYFQCTSRYVLHLIEPENLGCNLQVLLNRRLIISSE
jgi:hypothetical protein